MAHNRLLKLHGFTPLQLLFGHEPEAIEGVACDPEHDQDVTTWMAERINRKQAAYRVWLEAEAESRVERTQNHRTRETLRWPSGSRVKYWRADAHTSGVI